jgi:hypothetical protein
MTISVRSRTFDGHMTTYGILVENANMTIAFRWIDIKELWKPIIGRNMITNSVTTSPAKRALSQGT